MNMMTGLRLGLVATLLLFTAACGGGGEEGGEGAQESQISQAAVKQGQQIFTGKGLCQTCHGPDATGTQLAPDLTDDTWINIETPVTQEKIASLVKTGVPNPVKHQAPMPPMGGASLTDDELQAVSAYVYSLSHQTN